jgi:hypothetical protein
MSKTALKTSAARMRAASTPALPQRRRARRSENARVRVSRVVLPGHEIEAVEAGAGERISELLLRTGWSREEKVNDRRRWVWAIPTICLINGRPVLQRHWKRRRLKASDVVAFVARPHGGGGGRGKQIAGIVAVIALAAFAPWAGGALAGAIGLTGAAFTVGSAIIGGVIAAGGSLLLSTLFKPKPASQSDSNSTGQIDQLYTVQAQGNTARPFAPIPVQYGRLKIIPDYVTTPFSEYDGNDQYLNMLLSRGMGKYETEQVTTDDTEIWNSVDGYSEAFPGVELAHYNPGEPVTLFPTNIVSAVEVNGQSIEDAYVGGFIGNAAGTQTNALAIDLVFPGGCFNVSQDTGQIGNATISVSAEYRPVNDAGAPIGSWANLFSDNFQFASRTPIRISRKVGVASARYEVRMIRTAYDNRDGSVTAIAWAGLRSFIVGAPSSFPCSVTALRIKASAFTQDAARRIGIVQTRILPVWDSELEEWVEQPTRNPYWALYDAATNSEYGPRRPVSTIDFQTIVTRAADADAREKYFDYQFVSTVPVPEAFDTILKPDRARHRWSGDRLSVIRDEYRAFPRMLLTDRENVRDSVSIRYELQPEDAADCVVLEYVDEDTWRGAEVQYPPNSEVFTAERPSRWQIDGIVVRANAYEEAAFLYLQNLKRRIFPSIQTEHDGKLLGYGDTVALQCELPESWGQSGAIIDRVGRFLTSEREIDWTPDGDGQFYIRIRTKTGRQFGPIKCSPFGGGDNQIELDAANLVEVETQLGMMLADALDRADGAEEPSFEIGVGVKRARNCLILKGTVNGDHVKLDLVVNSEVAYPTDLSGLPAVPALPALRDPKVPVIAQLYASFDQGVAEPVLHASWRPAAGAQYYIADVSYDGGLTWAPAYEGQEPTFSRVVEYAALRLRVQGIGRARGGYYTVDVAAPTIEVAPNVVGMPSLNIPLRGYLGPEIQAQIASLEAAAAGLATTLSEQAALQEIQKQETRRIVGVVKGGLFASVEEVAVALASNVAALASLTTTVASHTDSISAIDGSVSTLAASVATNSTAITTLAGYAAAKYSVTLDVNGYAIGFGLINGGASYSVAAFSVDYFQVAKPGVSGGSPKAVFEIATVGGAASIAIKGSVIADETITAAKIAAATITGNKIAAATIDGDRIKANTIVTENIVSQAATSLVTANVSGGAVNNGDTLVSGAITTTTNNGVLLTFSANMFGLSYTNLNISVSILIDGSSILTLAYPAFGSTSSDGAFYILNNNLTLQQHFSVSAGSHTFAIVINFSTPADCNVSRRTLSLMESKR